MMTTDMLLLLVCIAKDRPSGKHFLALYTSTVCVHVAYLLKIFKFSKKCTVITILPLQLSQWLFTQTDEFS